MNLRLSRRNAMGALTFAALGTGILSRRNALAQNLRGALEGGIGATHEGLKPGSPDDQSSTFATALGKAAADGRPLFLPPGRYEVSDIALPERTEIVGIPGQSRVVLRGGSAIFKARHAATVRLEGMTLDGGGLPLGSHE